jgi:membrane protein DedA with SNARE-associated domain
VQTLQDILQALTELPPILIYLVLGAGAALENIVPPVPADTFVLAARGAANPWLVFGATWLLNVLSAIVMYGAARSYGHRFFKMPIARWLLREHQLEQIGGFYGRFGIPAIFVSRFLPGWRAMVPVFAGVSRMPAWKVVPPMAIASGLWYGLLVYLGAAVARNLQTIVDTFDSINNVLLWITGALLLAAGVWWWRSRHPEEEE